LKWRFADQLDWRLVMIHISSGQGYVDRGFTPKTMVNEVKPFRRFGMPVAPQLRSRLIGTERGCQTVVATRLLHPGREFAVLRALQFAWITTDAMLDEDGALQEAIAAVPGIDAGGVIASLDSPDVLAAYESDLALVRTASGSPCEATGRSARWDGPERYTAPSLIFDYEGRHFDAGGFVGLEVYDVAIANLAPDLKRRGAPGGVSEVLAEFPDGLTTTEVAAVMTPGSVTMLSPTDLEKVERALVDAVFEGTARRSPIGDDALWQPA
jgi:hypothetical protein